MVDFDAFQTAGVLISSSLRSARVKASAWSPARAPGAAQRCCVAETSPLFAALQLI